jgi:hypothetical protein
MAIDNRNKRRARIAACTGAFVATVLAVATTHAQVTQLDSSVLKAFPNVQIVTKTPAQGAVEPATGPTAGLRAFLDPATGMLTENPTEAHLKDLEPVATRGQRSAKAGAGVTTVRRGNAVGVQLDDSFMLHSVARRDADGDVDLACVTGDSKMHDFLTGRGHTAPHVHTTSNRRSDREVK